MKRFLKKIFPRWIIDILAAVKEYFNIKAKRNAEKSCCFLVQTPVHQNYGDHAIAYAEKIFLNQYKPIEITDYQLNALLKFPLLLKRLIKDGTIFITGGGNLGTLWFNIETNIRKTLQLFKDNRIIILPQTIFYEDSEFGKSELKKSQEIYNACENLTLYAREKLSYKYMKSIYNDVCLAPDMVFYLDEFKESNQRNGALVLLRDDTEKSSSEDIINQIEQLLKEAYGNVVFDDMISIEKISPEQRKNKLNEKFNQFRSNEIVLTDRLHGMIFSAVTGTPCIVLKCKSPKLKGVYDWLLADCEYILMTENLDKIKDFINYTKNRNFEPDKSIKNRFTQMSEEIKTKVLQNEYK